MSKKVILHLLTLIVALKGCAGDEVMMGILVWTTLLSDAKTNTQQTHVLVAKHLNVTTHNRTGMANDETAACCSKIRIAWVKHTHLQTMAWLPHHSSVLQRSSHAATPGGSGGWHCSAACAGHTRKQHFPCPCQSSHWDSQMRTALCTVHLCTATWIHSPVRACFDKGLHPDSPGPILRIPSYCTNPHPAPRRIDYALWALAVAYTAGSAALPRVTPLPTDRTRWHSRKERLKKTLLLVLRRISRARPILEQH